jgi:hypothetical protein
MLSQSFKKSVCVTIRCSATARATWALSQQELQETHPDLVRENSDGYLTAGPPGEWVLTKAMQQMHEKIDHLFFALIGLAFAFVALAVCFCRRAHPHLA